MSFFYLLLKLMHQQNQNQNQVQGDGARSAFVHRGRQNQQKWKFLVAALKTCKSPHCLCMQIELDSHKASASPANTTSVVNKPK